MTYVKFSGRYAKQDVRVVDSEFLREAFIEESPIGGEWGDAIVEYEDGENYSRIIVVSHEDLGFYLNYTNHEEVAYLSVWDRSRLSEIVCPDDINISAGLFLPRDKTYEALSLFADNGNLPQNVEWVCEEDMPENGNW